MAVYSWPSINPNESSMELISNTKQFVSPISGHIQTVSRQGTRWRIGLVYNNLMEADRANIKGILARLNGQEHRVSVGDYAYRGARGALGTIVEVDGANQQGTSLVVREIASGTSTISGFLNQGDLISFVNATGNSELKMVTADVDLTSGAATIPIMPEIHTSPVDSATIVTSSPYGTFMLSQRSQQWSDRAGQQSGVASPISAVSIDLIEDIT